MTRPTLSVVAASVAAHSVPAGQDQKPFNIPVLTELSPAGQKVHIYAAHDAILAFVVPSLGQTVKEALLRMAQLKASPALDKDYESSSIEKALKPLCVQLAKPRRRKAEERIAQVQQLMDAGYDSEAAHQALTQVRDPVWDGRPNELEGLHTMVGEGPTPIGYVSQFPRNLTRAEQAMMKPLFPYLDCYHRLGFPLYHDSYKHLIDVPEVLGYALPNFAYEEREARELKVNKAKVAQVAGDSPEAATRRAHAAILATQLGTHDSLQIREALLTARAAKTAKDIALWHKILEAVGIEVQPDDKDCAAIVVNPRRLVRMNPQALAPFMKLLGTTLDGARNVRFKLYV